MKILWTFDPFEKNKQLHEFGKNLVQHLFDKKDSIEILYVASNAEAQLATAFNIPAKRRYSSYPKELIKFTVHKGLCLFLNNHNFLLNVKLSPIATAI